MHRTGHERPSIPVKLFATGWNSAIRRAPKVAIQTAELAVTPSSVVSLAVKPQPVQVTSYCFDTPIESVATAGDLATDLAAKKRPKSRGNRKRSKSRTRLKPPGDAIRLADRLFYLLQPPLETWLESESFDFAFEPFPYQMAGVAFLYPRYSAVLADEMGLGKTMQAITAIRLLLRTSELRSVLLICPKPLVTNWKRELTLWAPEIPVAIIEGPQSQRAWQWQLDSVPVKIANYELLHRDRDLIADGQQKFDLVVLDEAQRIKNRTSTTSQVARAIHRNRSWALTGTPVENSAEDLLGIFEFISPGLLSPTMTPRRMGKAASDYILRRTKDVVMTDLPPKMYRDPGLELTPAQRQSYEMAEELGVVRLTEMGESATIQHVFELVLRLKQICNFDPATGDSAKLERLGADLEEVAASGKKAIVFSQWVETLKRLSKSLQRFSPLEYHGKVPSRKRDSILNQFRDDPNCSVILMSYGAGSVGLNLQFSEYVFLFDRWWNPAVEDQAINRAHRIGAAGPVTVTRFVTAATIEERIDQVLEQKRELFQTILCHADGSTGTGMSQSDIFGLFDLSVPQRKVA